jgi:hypothetical protein
VSNFWGSVHDSPRAPHEHKQPDHAGVMDTANAVTVLVPAEPFGY